LDAEEGKDPVEQDDEREQDHEGLVVVHAHAVVEPRAVVVHARDTPVAAPAVLGTNRTRDLCHGGKTQKRHQAKSELN
jgi:hypothetical protein